MGGGGVMKTAAKIAGIGVCRPNLRGFPVALPTEQSVRNASSPSSVAGVLSQGAKTAEVVPVHTEASWDEWDLADDGDLVVPRMVFGSVPTFEEAKEATAELKDAIDQSCVIETIPNSSVPNPAIQAFHLLSSSLEAQAVVASLACDPNVWNAVVKNPAVSSFLQSQLTVTEFGAEETEEVEKLSSCASEAVETPENMEASSKSQLFSNFRGRVRNLQLTVIELVKRCRVPGFLQNIFSSPDTEKEKIYAGVEADGNTKTSFFDSKFAQGGIFVGLVVMVIMVIFAKKRG